MANNDSTRVHEGLLRMVRDWMQDTEWVDAFEQHIDEFFEELSGAAEMPYQVALGYLPRPLGILAMKLCFEDFLTVEYEPDSETVIDEFLGEHGSDLSESEVEFLTAFKQSVVCTYRIESRVPGETLVLTDLVRKGDPITIEDPFHALLLEPQDCVAARIVKVGGTSFLAGTPIYLETDVQELFVASIHEGVKLALNDLPKMLRTDREQKKRLTGEVLRMGANLAGFAWTLNNLQVTDYHPLIGEGDEEDVDQTAWIARFPIIGPELAVLQKLDALPQLERPLVKEPYWNWPVDSRAEGEPIKAVLWLGPGEIAIENMSLDLMNEVIATLKSELGPLVGDPTLDEIPPIDEEDDFDDLTFFDDDEEEEEEEEDEVILEEIEILEAEEDPD